MIYNEQTELRRSINAYIDKYPSPTRAENDKLLRRFHRIKTKRSKTLQLEAKRIRDHLTLSNGGFAMRYVTRYKAILNDDVSMSDLFQEATLGLLETIDDFDTSRNTSFTTYAYFHIKKRIIDFIKKNKIVRAPRDIARNMKHVAEARNKLLTFLRREPTTQEIRRELRKNKGIILKTEMIDNITVLLELSSSSYEESFISEFKEQITNEPKDNLFKLMQASILTELEQNYDKINQEIIKLRFGIGKEFPHTLEEIQYLLDLKDGEL